MKFILRYILLQAIVMGLHLPAITQDVKDFEYYRRLNEQEKRLPEYKDSDDDLRLKLQQLEIINNSRRKHRAQPLELDILASRVANKICREAAENEYVSHWNLKGEKPYHRYAFAGGHDHVTENAYGEWDSKGFTVTSELIAKLMKNGHESFMAERAPNDGHKRNIIDKAHNYAGIGFYITKNHFRYYEEFLNRYLEYISVPTALSTGETGTIVIDTKGRSYLYFLICYREPFPVPLRPGQKPRKGSYEDFSKEVAFKVPAWELAGYRKGNIYSIPVSFKKEGLYYIQIFTDKKEIATPRAISTDGYYPVSGIVIKVTNP